VITSFRHKGLKQMFEQGQARLVDPGLRVRVANILAVLDAASSALDLSGPRIACTNYRGIGRESGLSP
jgi:plasmid maintenance system killer protein